MIDIHSHVIFNVDDGSDSLDSSLRMLKSAYEEGITDVICTPHYIYDDVYNKLTKELDEPFNKLKKALVEEKIDINLYIGNELYIPDLTINDIESHSFRSLNNSSYILVEFDFDDYKDNYDEVLYNLKIKGYQIIIAHPERYSYVLKDYIFVNRWLKEGFYLACNQNSLFKKDTKKFVFTMIEKGLLHFIASDSHDDYRPLTLKKAYDLVAKRYGKNGADKIFEINPRIILNNEKLQEMDAYK